MARFKLRYLKFFLVISACLALLFFNPFNISEGLRFLFFKVAYPFQKTFYFLSSKSEEAVEFWSSISSLDSENERLLKENNRLAKELALFKDVKIENESLRKQLELAPRDKFQLEAAFVIAKEQRGVGDWIMIDKGSDFSLMPGMPVVVDDGILVGQIKEVYANSSRVRLISDPDSVVNVLDVESGAKGIVKGEYGLGILLDLVEQNEAIKSGDMLATSGLGGQFPEGLLVGKITEIKSSKDKLFQQAIVTPQVRWNDLEAVFAIKK
ncbi:MAG: rod shape-determining protein MreC [Patescibacteria group bacterium]